MGTWYSELTKVELEEEVRMDIHDRVMGDKPDSFLHKIAGIIPGFKGYMERERRRDADKLLRTYLASQYSNGRARLTRVQQGMVRGRNLDYIAEVDRVAGVLQRFIDRLNTATYGYTGLFDPVKIEEGDLDQLYAFDMSLTAGVDQVSGAISALESAVADTTSEKNEVPGAISKLSALADELNLRLNQRQDFISTGRGLAQDEYNSMMGGLNQGMAPQAPPAMQAATPPPTTDMQQAGAPYMAPPPPMGTAGTPSTGAPTMPTGGDRPYDPNNPTGQMARVQGYEDESKPEVPRSSAPTQPSAEMGRMDEVPPIDEWPSAPSPWANKESGGDNADMSSTDAAETATLPRPSAGPSGYSQADMDAMGDTGSNRPWSGNADAFGSGGGAVTGGSYNSDESAGASDDGGIETASSPAMPGEDVDDKPRLSNDANDLDNQAWDDNSRQEDKG